MNMNLFYEKKKKNLNFKKKNKIKNKYSIISFNL